MADQVNAGASLGKRMQALRGEDRLKAIGEVVAQWRGSGRSQAAFCREVGIATVTLGRWIKRVEGARSSKSKAPVFVELEGHEPATDDAFEVVLSDGIWLRVPSSFDDNDLLRLLGVLSAAC